ncbi:MAG TPA: exodeoxyribonuclease VII large subunit [Nevskiaceae bacterium]
MPPEIPASRKAYSVSGLVQALRQVLETGFPTVWLEGELSNFSRPASGHWYFSLKDAHAQLRCAMFRSDNRRVRAVPQEGDQVLARGRVTVYDRRGDLQLICDHLEPAGIGALQREFERLKQRLEAEGLFDPARRRPIPPRPHRIGVITSGTGAALQDIVNTLRRRWPLAELCLRATPVQGAAAAPGIVAALAALPRQATVEVIILARGGGSLEDLWAFNEEAVARAVRGCAVPVITGVGHETDFTIADFAADLRAPTPTAAAERASPDAAELAAHVLKLESRVVSVATRGLERKADAAASLARRLARQHPRRFIQNAAQALDDALARLRLAAWRRHAALQAQLQANVRRVAAQHPRRRLAEQTRSLVSLQQRLVNRAEQQLRTSSQRWTLARHRLSTRRPTVPVKSRRAKNEELTRRLAQATRRQLDRSRAHLKRNRTLLASLGPDAVLARGFAIATDASGALIRDAATQTRGAEIALRLQRGRLHTTVRAVEPQG